MATKIFEERLFKADHEFHPVVPFDQHDRLLLMDFTENNQELTPEILNDTNQFIKYINSKLEACGARYGIGGYNEHRTIYSRSALFGCTGGEVAKPRRLHLGIDIWGKPYTKVIAPIDGIVHSFAFNNGYGDYGTTIILSHQLDGFTFHTLYGHLSLNSITNIREGDLVRKGDVFAAFGIPYENGHWPPHLHFQVIIDMQGMKGDYPGVCEYSEREKYLDNCPDPDLILKMMQLAKGEQHADY
jgi:murein DD-endopeptidase MepM/ murein hydrolase activator NlpD